MIEEMKIDPDDPNVDLEEWATQFAEEFQKYCEEEKKRREDNGLILCLVYEDQNYFINDEFKASFELRKEDLKDYVYVDNNSLNFSCESGYEDYYLNRTYKYIGMEKDCAIFYRNY
jgi:hypothetical protein